MNVRVYLSAAALLVSLSACTQDQSAEVEAGIDEATTEAVEAPETESVGGDFGGTGPLVMVTPENFKTAATHWEMAKYLPQAGGINQFFHFRTAYPIENQPTIRGNRDTIYSIGVIDISEGATLNLPDTGDRYVSAMIVNEDHYVNKVYLGGGEHPLTKDVLDTDYVIVVIRTLVDASDPADVAAVNELQDQYIIEANSSTPFVAPNYDRDSFDKVLQLGLDIGRYIPDTHGMFGKKEDVDSLRHFAGTAFGWGGLPVENAFYLNVEPGLPVGEYKIEVPAGVPVGQFWSVSLYNAEGFYEPNDWESYTVNSVTGDKNDDGSTTIHLGGCGDGRVNCVPIMEGWNYIVRQYEPGESILDGSWAFPVVEPY